MSLKDWIKEQIGRRFVALVVGSAAAFPLSLASILIMTSSQVGLSEGLLVTAGRWCVLLAGIMLPCFAVLGGLGLFLLDRAGWTSRTTYTVVALLLALTPALLLAILGAKDSYDWARAYEVPGADRFLWAWNWWLREWATMVLDVAAVAATSAVVGAPVTHWVRFRRGAAASA